MLLNTCTVFDNSFASLNSMNVLNETFHALYFWLLFAGDGGAQPVDDGAGLSCGLERTLDWLQLRYGPFISVVTVVAFVIVTTVSGEYYTI